MHGDRDYGTGGRHARPESVGRRGLLKAGLIAGAVVVPGSAILADKLLRHGEAAKTAAVPAVSTPPAVGTPPAVTPAPSPTQAAPPKPPKPAKPLAGKVIVLDPGHNPNNIHHLAQINKLTDAGGFLKACNTVGTETDAGFPEWAFNLDVARRARVILRSAGARVIMTQNGHTPYGPCNDWRARIANRARADASIAIHADGGPDTGYGFAALVPELVDNSDADNSAIIKPSAEFAQALLQPFPPVHRPASVHLPRRRRHPAPQRPGRAQPVHRAEDLHRMRQHAQCQRRRQGHRPALADAAAEGIAASIKAFVLR